MRACHGWYRKFQEDPHWRDHILFYEYFHGDTGWAGARIKRMDGVVASLIDECGAKDSGRWSVVSGQPQAFLATDMTTDMMKGLQSWLSLRPAELPFEALASRYPTATPRWPKPPRAGGAAFPQGVVHVVRTCTRI